MDVAFLRHFFDGIDGERAAAGFVEAGIRRAREPEAVTGDQKAARQRIQNRDCDAGRGAGHFGRAATGDLHVHGNVLRKWARELTADPQQASTGYGAMKLGQGDLECGV